MLYFLQNNCKNINPIQKLERYGKKILLQNGSVLTSYSLQSEYHGRNTNEQKWHNA